MEPASALPVATQEELCLTAAHGGCERFMRARDQRVAALALDQIEVGRLESARFGPFVSPVPIAVDARPPGGDPGGRAASGRRRMPSLLIGAGVILVGVVALAAIIGGGKSPGIVVISPSPVVQRTGSLEGQVTPAPVSSDVIGVAPEATLAPSSRPAVNGTASTVRATTAPTAAPTSAPPTAATADAATPGPTATPRPRPTPTVRPTATLRPTPTPEIARKYTVKQGDTIKSIADKFGLKPRDLRAINDIGKDVVAGQRLLIPKRSS
jgi:LysM repeat protein